MGRRWIAVPCRAGCESALRALRVPSVNRRPWGRSRDIARIRFSGNIFNFDSDVDVDQTALSDSSRDNSSNDNGNDNWADRLDDIFGDLFD